MFIRKLYYDLNMGGVLESSMRQGSVRMTTFAEDVATLPSLTGRTEADTGCMVWTEPDAVIEEAFTACTSVSVDVSQEPHQLVFDYTQPEVPQDIPAEEALAIIVGGETA